jgi:hypothetical protein
MADDRQERPSGNSNTHDPLPYIIRLRITIDEDQPSEVREFKVTAYSLMEALFQANFEAMGSSIIDNAKVKVEFIAPHEEEYWRRTMGSAVATAMMALRKAQGQ